MGIRILTIFDQGAWVAVRVIGLCQALIGEIIAMFYHPNPCQPQGYKNFQMLYSMIFGGWMLFHSSRADDLPSVVREKALNIGRLVLGLFTVAIITKIMSIAV